MIHLGWDNTYSWMREKIITYKVTVRPPTKESLTAGRRRRATACLKAVQDDWKQAANKLKVATENKLSLQAKVAELTRQLAEQKEAWQLAEKEEAWLLERRGLREEQERLLKQRLDEGWEDEGDKKKKRGFFG